MKEMFDDSKMSISDLAMAMTAENIENTAKANAAREVCVTTGGPDPGANCVFPFTYNGVEYNGCTSVDSDALWCSTKPSADLDEVDGWGFCPPTCQHHGNV